MAAPPQSNVFVQQINTSHNYGHRTNNTFHASLEELNNKLLKGYEIDLDSFDWTNVNCTHGERAFAFKKLDD